MGGDKAVYDKYSAVLDSIGDQVRYIGPIGAGSVAKLVHNAAGYAIHCAVAEVFTMGVKAGVEPLALWSAIRQGALGRKRTFERMADQFLQGKFEPPDFALALAFKDVTLATELAREIGVPMRLNSLAHAEMAEAMARGWGALDSRVLPAAADGAREGEHQGVGGGHQEGDREGRLIDPRQAQGQGGGESSALLTVPEVEVLHEARCMTTDYEVYAIKYARRDARRARAFRRRRSPRRADAHGLLRVADPQRRAHDRGGHGLHRRSGREAQARIHPHAEGGAGAAGRQGGRGDASASSRTCTTTTSARYFDFPQAQFHIQDEEMRYVTGRYMRHARFAHSMEVEDVVGMVRALYKGRLVFHNGVDEIAPGVSVHHIGGHTPGLQSVRVHTKRGWVCVASDATHYYEHFETGRCFTSIVDLAGALEGYDKLRRMADSTEARRSRPRSAGDGALPGGVEGAGRHRGAAGRCAEGVTNVGSTAGERRCAQHEFSRGNPREHTVTSFDRLAGLHRAAVAFDRWQSCDW